MSRMFEDEKLFGLATKGQRQRDHDPDMKRLLQFLVQFFSISWHEGNPYSFLGSTHLLNLVEMFTTSTCSYY